MALLLLEGHHMVSTQADTNFFSDRMIVVTGYKCKNFFSRMELESV
jgi:hypothetical protein